MEQKKFIVMSQKQKMKLKRGMRVSLTNSQWEGTITNIRERGVAGSTATYIASVEVTCDSGIVIKCDPNMCIPIERE